MRESFIMENPMTYRIRVFAFMFAVAVLAAITAVSTADHHGGDEEWTVLFNGKDLNNFVQRNGWAHYSIDGDAILGRTSEGSPNSFLCTAVDYGNFELRFEVKVDDSLNSGVQIRSKSLADVNNGRVHGPQVEIATNGSAGYIYGEATGRGWLSPEQPNKDQFKNGEWNEYRVLAEGKRIRTWVNGIAAADLSDDQAYEQFPSGFIGLQVHSIGSGQGPYEVRWRNLRIKELP